MKPCYIFYFKSLGCSCAPWAWYSIYPLFHAIQTLPGYSAFLADQTFSVKQSTPIFVRIRTQLWRQCCAAFGCRKLCTVKTRIHSSNFLQTFHVLTNEVPSLWLCAEVRPCRRATARHPNLSSETGKMSGQARRRGTTYGYGVINYKGLGSEIYGPCVFKYPCSVLFFDL